MTLSEIGQASAVRYADHESIHRDNSLPEDTAHMANMAWEMARSLNLVHYVAAASPASITHRLA